MRNRVAAIALSLIAVIALPGIASAQEDYPGGRTPERVPPSEVLGVNLERAPATPAADPQVLAEKAERPTVVAGVTTSRPALAVTGGDIAGLAGLGVVLVLLGVVLRRQRPATAV